MALERILSSNYEIQHLNVGASASASASASAIGSGNASASDNGEAGADADTNVAAALDEVWSASIAIGAAAAEFAATELDTPVVFCQVFDAAPFSGSDRFFGVAAIPPLELQLAHWKSIATAVESVGVIVAEGQTELIEEARAAAARQGLELHEAIAVTDRDSLYQFKRFAQAVNGLWLLPDNDVLSPAVIREMLDYARSHRVHSIVFSEALLDWGGLVSVVSDPEDVGATVSRVLDSVLAGEGERLPRVTPLTTVDARVNRELAAEFGLTVKPQTAPAAISNVR